jgi:hypothetical protein
MVKGDATGQEDDRQTGGGGGGGLLCWREGTPGPGPRTSTKKRQRRRHNHIRKVQGAASMCTAVCVLECALWSENNRVLPCCGLNLTEGSIGS